MRHLPAISTRDGSLKPNGILGEESHASFRSQPGGFVPNCGGKVRRIVSAKTVRCAAWFCSTVFFSQVHVMIGDTESSYVHCAKRPNDYIFQPSPPRNSKTIHSRTLTETRCLATCSSFAVHTQ